MSLPLVLGEREIPGETPYLRVPMEARRTVAPWMERKTPGRMRVGLVWAGNAGHVRDRFRSIPFAALAPLLDLEGVEFASLQMGGAAEQGRAYLRDWTAGIADLADTAARIEALDLAIGVDTAVVHLAGALGKPVWTMLPFWPDWRWGLEREDCSWYPTMRLFRQHQPGDWDGVIHRVRKTLIDAVAEGAAR